MEFLCEYDFEVKYIQGKENVVVDALSCRRHEVSSMILGIDLRGQILEALPTNSWYQEVSREIDLGRPLEGKFLGYVLELDGLLRFSGRIYVSIQDELHTLILVESHRAPYSTHPGVKKMYADL